ncbi:MAG: ABC transporter permease [Prevotellaceae bacterium]|jgi:ABC-2 type transport system permease protein|nr:ABC transporter permease [Prevotellaceae bacterium]
MKRFFGFIQKEFRHLFRDYRSLLILLGMPFVQILIFGFAITTEVRNIHVAFVDNSRDVESIRITNKILSSGYFISSGTINDVNSIEAIFRQGKVKLVVVFGNDFAKQLQAGDAIDIQLIADASDANTANLIVNYTQSIVQDYINAPQQSPQLVPEVKMLYNPNLKSVYMFVPGIICLLLMLISAIMTSISITREKEMGTMEVLLASPLKSSQIIIGKVIPYVLVSFTIGVIILAIGYTVFGMPFNSNVVLLLFEFVLFITLALALGILISTVTNSQQVALMVSMFALLLPVILLSGFIFPIENMPAFLQYLSLIMPPRWFIIIIKNIMLKGVSLEYVWKETLILAGMAVFLLTVSTKKLKTRLE